MIIKQLYTFLFRFGILFVVTFTSTNLFFINCAHSANISTTLIIIDSHWDVVDWMYNPDNTGTYVCNKIDCIVGTYGNCGTFNGLSISCKKTVTGTTKYEYKINVNSCPTNDFPVKIGENIYSLNSALSSFYITRLETDFGSGNLRIVDMTNAGAAGCATCSGKISSTSPQITLTMDPTYTGVKTIKNCILKTPDQEYTDDSGKFKTTSCNWPSL